MAGIWIEEIELVLVPVGGRGGGFTADRYIAVFVLEHVILYAGFIDDNFLLMHYKARCHTSRITSKFLEEVYIRTMDWPALSLDMNPIESLWHELSSSEEAEPEIRQPSNNDELKTALLEDWDGIPQDNVKNLLRSM